MKQKFLLLNSYLGLPWLRHWYRLLFCLGFVDFKSGLNRLMCLGSLTSRFFEFGIVLLSTSEAIDHFWRECVTSADLSTYCACKATQGSTDLYRGQW